MSDFNGAELNKIEIDVMRLILSQSEKRLEETIKTAEILTNKAYNLIQVFCLLAAGCIAYLVSNSVLTNPLTLISIIGVIISFVILFLCTMVFKMHKVRPLGHEPKALMAYDYSKYDKQEINLLYGCIKSIEKSIIENDNRNRIRSRNLKAAIEVAKWGLIISAVYALLTYF